MADIGPEVSHALATVHGKVIQAVEDRWRDGSQFQHIFFTGGGALALQGALRKAYRHGAVLPDPVKANAVGLARYARRVAGKGNGS
jgi:hypothetical protein